MPLDPDPTASSFQPPYYIITKDIAQNEQSALVQLTVGDEPVRRVSIAAYIE